MNSFYDVVEVFPLKRVGRFNLVFFSHVTFICFCLLCLFQIALQIADQVLERIEAFESRYLIHRDIKPVSKKLSVSVSE